MFCEAFSMVPEHPRLHHWKTEHAKAVADALSASEEAAKEKAQMLQSTGCIWLWEGPKRFIARSGSFILGSSCLYLQTAHGALPSFEGIWPSFEGDLAKRCSRNESLVRSAYV